MKLSVVICTYNGANFIEAQIRSIISQTPKINEIVVCDDGSSDETLEIMKNEFERASFSNYLILDSSSHLGVSANFLRGLKASSGDYVFCCDQDDVWCDDKVSVFLEAVNRSHKDLYFSDGYVVNSDLTKRDYSLWNTLHFSYSDIDDDSMLDILLSKCVVTGAAMLVSRRLIDMVDTVPDSWLHDGWFAMAAAAEGSIEPINSKTFLYRQHGSNVVGAHSASLCERVKAWVNGICKQPEVRRQRFDRYVHARDDLGIKGDAINGCLGFWGQLIELEEHGLFYGFITVIKLFANCSYSRYYTGLRGAIRDLLWLFTR